MVLLPTDNMYQSTKDMVLGKDNMNPNFTALRDFIYQTFGIIPLNIIYNGHSDNNRAGLYFVFEWENEVSFFDDSSNPIRMDSDKENGIRYYLNTKLRHLPKSTVLYCVAFAPAARMEANQSVSSEDIAQLQKEIGHQHLWRIVPYGAYVTFFVYTEEQANKYRNSKQQKEWTTHYFNLLKRYDELGYYKREEFDIQVDSKENFEKNYQGNWYYFYK